MMVLNGAFHQEKENERRLSDHTYQGSVLLQAFLISDQFSKLVVDWDEKPGFPFPGPEPSWK